MRANKLETALSRDPNIVCLAPPDMVSSCSLFYCTVYMYIFVGVHFLSELEPESAQEKSATVSRPIIESGVSIERCDLICVVICVSCTTVG